jgi:tetratricopeptide (TPR) repeat protein
VLTQSGITVGTPAYMSPEQGSGDRIDHCTDIYSLGVMLYEMVVGEVPYTAETPMAVVVKHIVDPLPIPRDKNPDIPEELQRVILKALAKKPEDRYQSVAALAAALEKVSAVHPDWSAAEITAVNAVRQPQIDQPETKLVEADAADQELADAVTVAGPADQDFLEESQATRVETEAQPEVAEDLAEAVTYAHAGDLDADEPDKEPAGETIAAPAEAVEQPKRSRRWLLYFWGAVTLFVVVMIVLSGLGAIRSAQDELNLTDEAQIQDGSADEPGLEEDQVDYPRIQELLDQGEYELAGELAVRMVRRDPNMWEPFMGLVYRLVERGNVPQAVRLLEAGLEVNPDAPAESYVLLGGLMREQGLVEESLPAFEEALRRNPGFLDAHNALVFTAIDIGQAPREIDFLHGLAEEHPEEALIYRSLGELYLAVEDWDAAIGNYERALELAPDVPQILVRAASAYIAVGDHGMAVELLDRAVELAPEDPNLLGRAGTSFLEMEMMMRARELYARAFELDPNNGGNAIGLAITSYYLGVETDRIPALLERAEELAREQEDPWLMAHLGWTYVEMDDCDNAIRIFEIVEEFAPGETNAREGLDQCR